MNGASLVTGIREHLRNGLQHTRRFLSPMISLAPESPRSLSHTKNERQLSLSSFHSFCCADDLTEPATIYANSHKDGDIPDLTTPAAFEIDTVYIDIG